MPNSTIRRRAALAVVGVTVCSLLLGPSPGAAAATSCKSAEGDWLDAGVLPLENSLAGTVGDALDALATGSLTVIGEVLQPIHHQLLVLPGGDLAAVEHVTSHWQALSQCDRFLSRHGWHQIPAADTAPADRVRIEDRHENDDERRRGRPCTWAARHCRNS